MAGRCAGKLALVTGAAQGLGAAHARRLAEEGARVLCTDINGDGAQATAASIVEELGAGHAYGIQHDVTNPDDWERAIETADAELGGLNVLVNNAGYGAYGPLEATPIETLRRLPHHKPQRRVLKSRGMAKNPIAKSARKAFLARFSISEDAANRAP